MTYLKGFLTGSLVTLICAGATVLAWWIITSRSPAATKTTRPPPAVVSKPLKEEQINTIVLTQEAVKRLALRTAAVEFKPMPRTRVYGGEVTVPPGHTIIVSAPVSGMLRVPPGGIVSAGQEVRKKQILLHLLPLLTPEGRASLAASSIDAEGQVKSAKTHLEAARIAFERAKRVFQSDTGSRKALDEAQAQFDLAQKAVEVATARRDLFANVASEVDRGTAAALPIESPSDGLLRNVAAVAGQTVPAGGTLFEVVDLSLVWVRVPVYVGDLPEIASKRGAAIGGISDPLRGIKRYTQLAAAPPSANASTATVDLYYQVPNEENTVQHIVAAGGLGLMPAGPMAAAGGFVAGQLPVLHPGQRVGVTLFLRDEENSLVVPWSAVVHDIHGGTWVYEQHAERTYTRQRVVVRNVVSGMAVLLSGPARDANVVADGAAELFGAETGFTK